jgi:hypothetical protein
MPLELVRIVSDLPLTAAVAVLTTILAVEPCEPVELDEPVELTVFPQAATSIAIKRPMAM